MKRTCVVCDREKEVEEMVLVDDFYVCATKECLLGALENAVASQRFSTSRRELREG